MTKVINFFAGPGAGKSTCATGVQSALKRLGKNSEYVPEYAKELAWKEDRNGLKDQFHVFGEQHFRQSMMIGKVDYLVCDSPLVLGVIYAPPALPDCFRETIWWAFNQYDNYNFYVNRRRHIPYLQAGRFQDEDGARRIDDEVKDLLEGRGVDYTDIYTDEDHVRIVLERLGL